MTDPISFYRRPTLFALGVAALVFAAVAPTLAWQEFSSGSENLVVESALEMRRGGSWLVPTLQGLPRMQKPPLAMWTTAAAVRPATVAALGDADPARRRAAYRRLAGEVRRPALATACLMLVAVYALGRTVAGDARVGLAAAAVAGTTVLFLRFGRYASTDVPLALWIAAANAMLARAVLDGRWWSGCLAGGAALGVAFLTKGPVALVQTIAPVAAFVGWRAWARGRNGERRSANSLDARSRGIGRVDAAPVPWLPVLAGLLVVLAVNLPWYSYMARHYRHLGILPLWFREVTRRGATGRRPDPVYLYLLLVPLLLPWAALFVAGAVGAARDMLRGAGERIVLALLFVLVPLGVMTLASPDRQDRYLLPLVGPAAVLSAWGLRQTMRPAARADGGARLVVASHWALVLLVAIGLPVLGAWPGGPLAARGGGPWFGWGLAGSCAAGFAVVALVGMALARRWRGMPRAAGALVAATAAVMLGAQALAAHGYRRSDDGLSEMRPMADAVWAAYPDAVPYYVHNRRSPNDLSIYLDRITGQAGSFEQIPPSDRPRVAVVIQREGEPPVAAPPGWTFLTTVARGRDRMHAFVSPAGR